MCKKSIIHFIVLINTFLNIMLDLNRYLSCPQKLKTKTLKRFRQTLIYRKQRRLEGISSSINKKSTFHLIHIQNWKTPILTLSLTMGQGHQNWCTWRCNAQWRLSCKVWKVFSPWWSLTLMQPYNVWIQSDQNFMRKYNF